jgi:hypothetical protein
MVDKGRKGEMYSALGFPSMSVFVRSEPISTSDAERQRLQNNTGILGGS